MDFLIQRPLFIRSMKPFISFKDLFLKTEESDDKPKGDEVPGWAKKLQETLESLVPKQETQTEDKPLEVPTPPPPATVEEEDDQPPTPNPVKKFLDWLM